MRKTQTIGPSRDHPIDRTVFSAAKFSTANWAPVALFAVAYIAILAVLFAPEGYFNGDQTTAVSEN